MFNELIKNVMSLGIITDDDVKRLTGIELMLLIIERSNGLLTYLKAFIQENDVRMNALDKKYKEITDDIKQSIIDNETYFNEVIKDNLQDIALVQLNDWLSDGTLESLINQTALANISNRVTLIEQCQSYVSPLQTNDDIQLAIDLAVSSGVRKVMLEAKTYVVTDTVLVPSNFTLEGIKGVSTIKMVGVDKPIIGKQGGIESGTHIKNIKVIGDTTLSNNHGIVINDFWSTVEGCTIEKCGGHGIHLSSENASGTLVENKIKDCVVRDCGSYSYYLGEEDNKLTDGYLINCLSNGSWENGALFIGSSAGWTIDGLHTYNHGGASGVIAILNGFNTNINNLYVEDFKETCISMTKIQRNINLSNVNIVISDSSQNTTIFNLNKSSAFPSQANVNISNLAVANDTDKYATIVGGDGSWVVTNVSNLSVTGGHANKIISSADTMKANTSIIRNINVDGKIDVKKELKGTANQLIYAGWTQSKYMVGNFTGNSETSFTVTIPTTYEWGRTLCKLTMYSRVNFDGAKSVNYVADIYLTRKGEGTSYIMPINLTTPSGFTSEPNYSFNVDTGELTVTFTPSTESGQGIWKFELFD